MSKLKYPEGSIISWCDEYYKVIRNMSDWSGSVMDAAGDISSNFYFSFQNEDAVLITDKTIIQEVNGWIKAALKKKQAEAI